MSHQSLTSLLGSCSTMHYDKVKGLASKCHSCNRPQMETLNHLFIHSDQQRVPYSLSGTTGTRLVWQSRVTHPPNHGNPELAFPMLYRALPSD